MAFDGSLFPILQRHDVPFIIIGGHAVYFHGFERLTEDCDIVWRRSPESERALLAASIEIGARYIGKEIDPATKIERMYPVTLPYIQQSRLMMLWTDHGFLDVFDYIPGQPDEPVERLFETSVEADGLRYASLEHVRKMKRAANRTKDLLDLEELEKLYPEDDFSRPDSEP